MDAKSSKNVSEARGLSAASTRSPKARRDTLPPYRLTPSEIESLRRETKADAVKMERLMAELDSA